MRPHDSDHAAIAAAFLDRYLQDARAGSPRPLEEYQAAFPGHDDVIAREFAQITRDSDAPDRIGHYTVIRLLGRGGQGAVYLARDENLGREVALKVLPDHGLLSQQALARFRREAEITARLDHPNICTVLDSGRCDGVVYIAMRYVEGETLAEALADRQGALDSRDVIFETTRIFERVCRAVHAAHQAGVVHRDLKPANIMLNRHGDPVVLDFGLATGQALDGIEQDLTRTGEVFGTPWYMSPEQLRGDSQLDARTDVYSLGASLYECVTGHRPIEASSREALYQAILDTPVRDPRQHNPKLPRDLCSVLTIALEKDPDQRYPTAEALADDLRRVVEFEPIVARPPSSAVRAWRWVQRNRTVASLTATLIAVLAVGLFVSIRALRDSERARADLSAALEDIRAGRESKRQREVEATLLEAYQTAYSADSRRAPELFEHALRLDPGNLDAFAGRIWLEIGPAEFDMTLFDRFGQHVSSEVIDWMKAFIRRDDEPESPEIPDALRLYWRGLRAVGGFMTATTDEQKREALELFERAALRADRPRFHHHHSMLMTAARLGDEALMETYAANLEYLWPDTAATHEAIAQFFMQVDRPRAIRSLEALTTLTRSAAPYCGLAFAAMTDGDHDAALAYFDKGIEVDPTFTATWLMRGQLHLRANRVDEARADFERALAQDPDSFAARAALDGLRVEAGSGK